MIVGWSQLAVHIQGKTRKLTKSARTPQQVDPSPPETQNAKFKVIGPNSKVTEPKFCARPSLVAHKYRLPMFASIPWTQ